MSHAAEHACHAPNLHGWLERRSRPHLDTTVQVGLQRSGEQDGRHHALAGALLCATHCAEVPTPCCVQGQISMLSGWMERILASEDWTRVSKQRAHGSRCALWAGPAGPMECAAAHCARCLLAGPACACLPAAPEPGLVARCPTAWLRMTGAQWMAGCPCRPSFCPCMSVVCDDSSRCGTGMGRRRPHPRMNCIPLLAPSMRRSVVETIKIVTETLEALFNMRLAIPAGVVRCLTEGVDNALQK